MLFSVEKKYFSFIVFMVLCIFLFETRYSFASEVSCFTGNALACIFSVAPMVGGAVDAIKRGRRIYGSKKSIVQEAMQLHGEKSLQTKNGIVQGVGEHVIKDASEGLVWGAGVTALTTVGVAAAGALVCGPEYVVASAFGGAALGVAKVAFTSGGQK